MKRPILAAMALALLAGVSSPCQVLVFVSAPIRDGFVDASKDIQDSVRDLKKRLAKAKKEVRVVNQRGDADIVVTIVARGVGSQAYGQRLSLQEYYNNTTVTSVPTVANTFWVATVMEAGDYRREITGTYTQDSAYSMGAWTACANRIAKDLRSWVEANSGQIRQTPTSEKLWRPY